MSPPRPGCGDLWYACPDQLGDEQVAELGRLLAPDERERAAGFLVRAARVDFIATRALLRLCLSRYADVAPEAWRFTPNPHGKPTLDAAGAEHGLHFNVSHTQGASVCVVAGSEVGVDIQYTRRPPAWRVLERYLAATERAALRDVPEAERSARFFEYWTLKEAYVKARGLGFALPLSQVGCRFEGEAVVLELGPGCDDDASRWSMSTWRATPVHQLSIAIESAAGGKGVARPLRWGLGERVPLPARLPTD